MSEHLTTTFVADTMRAHGYLVMAGPEAEITGGAADSRNVQPGDLFTAFPGERMDGNRFVGDALTNGAVAAICERVPQGTSAIRRLSSPRMPRAPWASWRVPGGASAIHESWASRAQSARPRQKI